MSLENRQVDPADRLVRVFRGARPPSSVERRIVEDALAQRRALGAERAKRGRRLLAAAGAALAGVLGVIFLGSPRQQRSSTAGDRAAEPSPALLATSGARNETSAKEPPVEAPGAPSNPRVGSEEIALGRHRIRILRSGRIHIERFDPDRALVRIDEGEASFEIAPLRAGQSFAVETPHVKLSVIGTRFTVRALSCTEVIVGEGRVRAVAGAAAPLEVTPGHPLRTCQTLEVTPSGAEEALIGEAMALAARGRDLERASALIEEYLAAYPGGLYEEEGLFHAWAIELRRGGDARANADRFLARFPTGRRAEQIARWREQKERSR